MGKTANEMFEALGFLKHTKVASFEKEGDFIDYTNNRTEPTTFISFCVCEKSYIAYTPGISTYWIPLDLFRAIQQQMQELGWLEESPIKPSTIEYAPNFVRECEKRGGDVE